MPKKIKSKSIVRRPSIALITAMLEIVESGERAYKKFESESGTDFLERGKWRNCAAACKVIRMRLRKLTGR